MEYPSSTARQSPDGTRPPAYIPAKDPDEINLLEYLYVLVRRKKFIAGLTLLGFICGFIAALIKGPTWIAEALIMPKETESQKSPSLAGLGALSGLMASQLNLSGNASLDKMDLILDSRDFGAKLIDKYSFLPVLYQYQWPKKYKKSWDPAQKNWKPTFKIPQPLSVGDFLKIHYLKKTKDVKANTILLKIKSKDSTFTINLATMYVTYLNEYIKSNIQKEAKENVAYLDTQMVSIVDPLLREKILGFIANEIEKQMVVSKEAFNIVDPVYCHKNFKSKKLYPLFLGFVMFFLGCLILVFQHAVASSSKTQEDRDLIDKIKKEIHRKF